MPERDHWKKAVSTGAIAGTFICLMVAIGSRSRNSRTDVMTIDPAFQPGEQVPFPQQDQFSAPQQQPETFSSGNACPAGFEGRQLQKGEWPLTIIREYGPTGTEDSPVIYIDRKGVTHQYDNWRGFKGYQHPGETICVPHRKGSSIENKQHIIYSANVQTTNRTQRRGF